MAIAIKQKFMAIFISAFIPSVITLFITFGIHQLKGTPKPLESTIPTLLIFPTTLVWGYKKRKRHLLRTKEIHQQTS
jgi:hypothetical protein